MKNYDHNFKLDEYLVSVSSRPFFIADIAANHDGSIERAKDLIYLAKESGADVAKFQHFKAKDIVSDVGFSKLSNEKMSHQATWKKSVAEIYDDYHTKREWNDELIKTCRDAEIQFMTTPYDISAMDSLLDYVHAIKIGSGDITYKPFLKSISKMGKPILLATGASNIDEVISAMDIILEHNTRVCLMQCNTNYTGSLENYKYVNLKVLKTFANLYPNMPLGLSDHTPGHSVVLGAIAYGANVIEKHFTDDNSRVGPDHHFALNGKAWRSMVDASMELFFALGDGIKRIEKNEEDTVIVQRRAIRAKADIEIGQIITEEDLECLRPCPSNSLTPFDLDLVLGKTAQSNISKGEDIQPSFLK
jgi:sialic acid synthase SpsE